MTDYYFTVFGYVSFAVIIAFHFHYLKSKAKLHSELDLALSELNSAVFQLMKLRYSVSRLANYLSPDSLLVDETDINQRGFNTACNTLLDSLQAYHDFNYLKYQQESVLSKCVSRTDFIQELRDLEHSEHRSE